MTRTTTTKLLMALLAVGLMAAACGSDQTTRDDAGVIVEGGDLGVFSASTGDCVNVPDGEQISQFEGVACNEPHDAQVYAAFDLPGDVFPGLESIRTSADEGCAERWEPFFEIEYAASEYFFTRVTPTMESWNKVDDREILCLVTSGPGDEPLTEDLRGYGANLPDEVAADVAEDDPVEDVADAAAGDDVSTSQDLTELVMGAGPLSIDGTLPAASTADYSLVLETGQSIGVTLSSAGAAPAALGDPVLSVSNAAGVDVAANDDADGLNSALVYTAESNGSYTINVSDLTAAGGDFELVLELVDVGQTPSIGAIEVVESDVSGSLVAELAIGAASTVSTSDALEAGAYDVVQLTVDEAVSATITVTGEDFLDTRIAVMSNGTVVAENDDAPVEVGLPSVLDSQVIVDLDAGVYEIEVRSFADVGQGGYTLDVVTG
jgi:hypothetical protein